MTISNIVHCSADQWDLGYIKFLFNNIEEAPSSDHMEEIPDSFLTLLLSYNQHFSGDYALPFSFSPSFFLSLSLSFSHFLCPSHFLLPLFLFLFLSSFPSPLFHSLLSSSIFSLLQLSLLLSLFNVNAIPPHQTLLPTW